MKKCLLFCILLVVMQAESLHAQNRALTATASHSGGGVTIYGPQNYNDGNIPPFGSLPWGWVSTGGSIEFVWTTAQTVDKIKLFKANRPITSFTLQYWNGAAYVNIANYNSTTNNQEDSVVFSPVTTTRIRMFDCYASTSSSGNPNHREIEIWTSTKNNLAVTDFSPYSGKYCDSMDVIAHISNLGSNHQTGFTVSAFYNMTSQAYTLSKVYTDTLFAGTTDTVFLGRILPPPGFYNMSVATILPNDEKTSDDTLTGGNFTINPQTPVPLALSDTVCAGDSFLLMVVSGDTATTHNWYADPMGSTWLFSSDSLVLPPAPNDTVFYVSAVLEGCESEIVPIYGALGNPPVVDLGPDTSFCESIPLVLDGGNPGAKYIWSTGDTTRAISILNESGTYWVEVDKYCKARDTVVLNIDPLPWVAGISYVRMNNLYQFSASNVHFVGDYYWDFGDGTTSTLPSPIHAYPPSVDVASMVMLVVSNPCGHDTVGRTVPTSVAEISAETAVYIYPNPARDEIIIGGDQSIQKAILYNLMGQKALEIDFRLHQDKRLDVKAIPSGQYLLRCQSESGMMTLPVQISR